MLSGTLFHIIHKELAHRKIGTEDAVFKLSQRWHAIVSLGQIIHRSYGIGCFWTDGLAIHLHALQLLLGRDDHAHPTHTLTVATGYLLHDTLQYLALEGKYAKRILEGKNLVDVAHGDGALSQSGTHTSHIDDAYIGFASCYCT